MNHIEQERAKLFEVVKLKLTSGLEGYTAENAYGIFPKNGGKSLGLVGKDYFPTQSTLLFDNFVSAMSEVPKADLNSLKVTELKEGKKCKITCDLGLYGFVNMIGKDDEMEVKIDIQTGWDGFTKTSIFLSTYRLVCSNGLKGWSTERIASFKNTVGNNGKINILSEDVAKVLRGKDQYLEKLRLLNERKVSAKEVKDYLNRVLKIDTTKTLSTRTSNILDQINASVAIEEKNAGMTAFTLLNGITHYTNHVAKAKDRQTYLYSDRGMVLNDLAQKHAFDLILN